MFVGVPKPKPLHRFSLNFQDVFVPRGSRADYFLGVSGGNCCHGNTLNLGVLKFLLKSLIFSVTKILKLASSVLHKM